MELSGGARRLIEGARGGEDPSAGDDVRVRRGLAMTDAALAKNPHSARALLARGRLYRLQIRAARLKPERSLADSRAKVAATLGELSRLP